MSLFNENTLFIIARWRHTNLLSVSKSAHNIPVMHCHFGFRVSRNIRLKSWHALISDIRYSLQSRSASGFRNGLVPDVGQRQTVWASDSQCSCVATTVDARLTRNAIDMQAYVRSSQFFAGQNLIRSKTCTAPIELIRAPGRILYKFKFKFKLNTSSSGPQASDRNLWVPLFARL